MNKSPEQRMIESVREQRSNVTEQSSISRIHQHLLEHDTAILTAFRDEFSGKENQERNRELRAYLLTEFYGVTEVDGSFMEILDNTKVKVKEDSFLVVNLKDRPGFFIDLFKLGEYYDQDSILYIPQGGEGGYLWGTNETGDTGYGNKQTIGDFHVLRRDDDSDYVTRFRERPFKFETINTVTGNGMGRMGVAATCRKVRKYTESHGMFIRLSSDSDYDSAWPWPKRKEDRPFCIPVGTIEEAINHAEAFRDRRDLGSGNWGLAEVWEDGKRIGRVSYDCVFHEKKRKKRVSNLEKKEDSHVPNEEDQH